MKYDKAYIVHESTGSDGDKPIIFGVFLDRDDAEFALACLMKNHNPWEAMISEFDVKSDPFRLIREEVGSIPEDRKMYTAIYVRCKFEDGKVIRWDEQYRYKTISPRNWAHRCWFCDEVIITIEDSDTLEEIQRKAYDIVLKTISGCDSQLPIGYPASME